MDVSRSQAANPNSGTGLELDVIAAVVIGGTSLMGGRGSVISSLLGVAIIAVLGAGLAARGVRDETKRLITGCVIVLAVILDYYRHRFSQRRESA
jgi:ribose transport system permease protein